MKKNYTLFNIMSLLLILLSIFLHVGSFRPTHSTVDFEDPGLEQAVLDAIEQEEEPIVSKDVEMLEGIDETGYGIESVEGIVALHELSEHNLEGSYVKSVSSLQKFNKLEHLSLRNNDLADLDAIDFDDFLF